MLSPIAMQMPDRQGCMRIYRGLGAQNLGCVPDVTLLVYDCQDSNRVLELRPNEERLRESLKNRLRRRFREHLGERAAEHGIG